MNDQSSGHRPRPARLRLAGVLLVIIGIVAVAACSSTHTTASGATSTSSAYAKALKYAQCIRAHGVPNFPDPNSKGQFVAQNGNSLPNVSNAVMGAATKACQKLFPPSMAKPPTAGKVTHNQLKFSECMRRHGEPGFPDPASNGKTTLPKGMNPQSPQFQKAEKACQSLMPSNPSGGSAP